VSVAEFELLITDASPNEHAIQGNERSEKNWADLGYTGLFNL